ncbi:MAG: thrombospondin type 3 repeat-containing protein [archaeon]
MKKTFAFIAGILFVLIISAFASAQSCAVSPGFDKPLMPDTDCDGMIDRIDNCPYITNPLQQDADGNGLGDACDLYLESINTNPGDFVFNGRAFNVIATMHNNRDYNIRNLKVRVIIPELGIESVQYIDNLEVCESNTLQFMLRAPICAPLADYHIFVEATFMNMFGMEEVIPGITSIRVVPDQYCQMVLDNNQLIGNTMIDVMEIQDVYKGSGAVFPIKISNREFDSKEYIFSAVGLDGWGHARFSPSTLLVIPSESERIADLYVTADDNVAPGERVFVVSVKSGEEVQRFLLIANVKEKPVMDTAFMWIFAFKILLIATLIVLLIVAVVIGYRKYVEYVKKDATSGYY